MAQPGEFFPMQFAMGILSLQSQQREAAARLQQLRESQAQQSALEQQRIQLAQVGQAQQARHQAFSEAQAETGAELAKQRFSFEIKQHEDLLKNQDAKALASLGAGEDAFFRAGGPQPPPEALEGPEVEVDGQKKPAYRMSKIDLPGVGTFYHKIDDAKLQEQFDDMEARHQERVSQSILRLQQARYQQQRADNYNGQVAEWHSRRIAVDEVKLAQHSLDVKRNESRILAQQISREAEINNDEAKRRRAAALLADPYAESDEKERNQADTWRAIIEAYSLQLKNGGPSAAPKSLTGTHPDEIQAQVDKLTALFSHKSTVPELQAQTIGIGNIAKTVFLTPGGTLSETAVPGSRRATLRSYFGPTGKVIGTDLRDLQGEVLSATGASPFAKTRATAATPAAAPPTAATPAEDTAKKKQDLLDAFRAGKITREDLARLYTELNK